MNSLTQEKQAKGWLERQHLKKRRRNIYIACEEKDFGWDEDEVLEFDWFWEQGLFISEIAEYFERDYIEVVFLMMDRAEKGFIETR